MKEGMIMDKLVKKALKSKLSEIKWGIFIASLIFLYIAWRSYSSYISGHPIIGTIFLFILSGPVISIMNAKGQIKIIKEELDGKEVKNE